MKSASFRALTSAPAASSTRTASSALGERTPRGWRGVYVARPSPAAAMNGVVPSSVVRCWSAPASSSVRRIPALLAVRLAPTPNTWPPAPFMSNAATHSGVAPRRSPVPHANGSNAPFFG